MNQNEAPNLQPESLWDVGDAAAYLKVSKSWIYRSVESGKLPCLRIGPLLRFLPDAVRTWARADRTAVATVVPIDLKR
jgi:excisionase family DNA binding protein